MFIESKIKIREQSLEEKLTLSPWEKWKKYRIFPCKFLLEIILVIVVTVQISIPIATSDSHVQACKDSFDDMFMPEGFEPDDNRFHSAYFYKMSDVVEHIQKITETYLNFDSHTLDKYIRLYDYIEGDYYYYPNYDPNANDKYFDRSVEITKYNLTLDDPNGPFVGEGKELLYTFNRMQKFSMTLKFSTYYISTAKDVGHDFWTVTYTFDYSTRGYVELRSSSHRQTKTVLIVDYIRIALDILVIIFSLWSLFLYIRSIVVAYRIMKESRVIYGICFRQGLINTPWDALPFKARMRFFNYWYILFITANILTTIGAACELLENTNTISETFYLRLLIGLGAFFTYLCAIRYLEWFKRYYMLIYALRASLGVCATFFVGVIPIYLAFAEFGVAVYSQYIPKFDNLFQAFITLFGMMNGDALIEAFHECYNVSVPVTTVYLLSFLIFFIFVVLNLFVAIIEEAYHLAKRRVNETISLEQRNSAQSSQQPTQSLHEVLASLNNPPSDVDEAPLPSQPSIQSNLPREQTSQIHQSTS